MIRLSYTRLRQTITYNGGGGHCQNMDNPPWKIRQRSSSQRGSGLVVRDRRGTAAATTAGDGILSGNSMSPAARACSAVMLRSDAKRRQRPQMQYEHLHHAQSRTWRLSHLALISRQPVRTAAAWVCLHGNIRQTTSAGRLVIDNLSYSSALIEKPSSLAWLCADI